MMWKFKNRYGTQVEVHNSHLPNVGDLITFDGNVGTVVGIMHNLTREFNRSDMSSGVAHVRVDWEAE